ncbi:hypothetical protein GIB67_013669 [Kingdonia uniflora]|uniref:Uncharacterized protein n=1 Tax=Kingdonia uniflora TaxID=39325 RepID=A0A7J7NPX8_9MAGN|nr:hypothetical protein GIB67_013669 [Kingdonia uniflora]
MTRAENMFDLLGSARPKNYCVRVKKILFFLVHVSYAIFSLYRPCPQLVIVLKHIIRLMR